MYHAWGPDRRTEEQKKAGPRGPNMLKATAVVVATVATGGAGTAGALGLVAASEAVGAVEKAAE